MGPNAAPRCDETVLRQIGGAREAQKRRTYRVYAKDDDHFERNGARSEGVADDVNIFATGFLWDRSRLL